MPYDIDMDQRYKQFKLNSALPMDEEPLFAPKVVVAPEKQESIPQAPQVDIAAPVSAEEFKIKEPAEAAAKGLVQGALGAPMDLVGLATGLLNMLTVDPEQKGNLQQFLEGYGAVPFTSEKVKQILEDLGWETPEGSEGAEFLGEMVAPTKVISSAVKGGAKALSTMKKGKKD
jgi:hypothetical protein